MAAGKKAPIAVAEVSGGAETVQDIRETRQIGATKTSMREYDWTRCKDEPKAEGGKAEEADSNGYSRELSHQSQGGDVGGCPGERFALEDEPDQECRPLPLFNYGELPDELAIPKDEKDDPDDDGKAGDCNELRCIPMEVPHRPSIPAKEPDLHGVYLATVIGRGTGEVDTDRHGRVLIQFHWGRNSSKKNPVRRCWARVATAWAGPSIGTLFLPQVGTEVLVQFIEGDPDRPVVVACLFDSVNTPSMPFSSNKPLSAIPTRGSPRHVDKNQVVIVQGSQNVIIGDQGDPAQDGIVGSKLDVAGDYKVNASKTISEEAPDKIVLTCGESSLEMTPKQIKITAGGKAMVILNTDAVMVSSQGSKTKLDVDAELSTPQTAKIVGGKGNVTADSAGVAISGPNVHGTGGMELNLSAPVIKIN